MIEVDKQTVVVQKMNNAYRALEEVPVHCSHGFYNTAINRLYYACYYAATSALLTRDVMTKTHEGVRQKLGYEFAVKTSLLTREQVHVYALLFSKRTTADYDDMVVYTQSDVDDLYPLVHNLIDGLCEIVRAWYLTEYEEMPMLHDK